MRPTREIFHLSFSPPSLSLGLFFFLSVYHSHRSSSLLFLFRRLLFQDTLAPAFTWPQLILAPKVFHVSFPEQDRASFSTLFFFSSPILMYIISWNDRKLFEPFNRLTLHFASGKVRVSRSRGRFPGRVCELKVSWFRLSVGRRSVRPLASRSDPIYRAVASGLIWRVNNAVRILCSGCAWTPIHSTLT